jgi:hypothetical protein
MLARNDINALGDIASYLECSATSLGGPNSRKMTQYKPTLAAIGQAMTIAPDLGAARPDSQLEPPQTGVDDANITRSWL